MNQRGIKRVNLALQGGGSHGAFGWGVLDRLAEDGRLEVEGVSAASAGSMNAVVYAQGLMAGGNDGARAALEEFWKAVSDAGRPYAPASMLLQSLVGTFSPYQFNPFNVNPLRDVLEGNVDMEAVRACDRVELFICATNVRNGQPRIFSTPELTLDMVLASACVPSMFQAVEVNGEHYWDGGYMGNPPLYPLIYNTRSRDIVIVHINPIVRPRLPTSAEEIRNRLNEITFNSSLIREFRAIAFVTKLIEQGWLKDEHRDKLKRVLIHSIRSDEVMCDLDVASKFNTDWDFLCELRDRGRAAAASWLEHAHDSIGERSTVDLRAEYLGEVPTDAQHD
jgi:NTE family protein